MRIFHYSKKNEMTGGFVLLKTLILFIAVLLLLSVVLAGIAALLQQAGALRIQAEQYIFNRNQQTYRELDERE